MDQLWKIASTVAIFRFFSGSEVSGQAVVVGTDRDKFKLLVFTSMRFITCILKSKIGRRLDCLQTAGHCCGRND